MSLPVRGSQPAALVVVHRRPVVSVQVLTPFTASLQLWPYTPCVTGDDAVGVVAAGWFGGMCCAGVAGVVVEPGAGEVPEAVPEEIGFDPDLIGGAVLALAGGGKEIGGGGNDAIVPPGAEGGGAPLLGGGGPKPAVLGPV
ncbi:MAG TPA: hypothetical protein VEI29_00490 [Burkholderiaceae bacterium]|nr:hypothetical protein [Burkholderiaceae bacterium]